MENGHKELKVMLRKMSTFADGVSGPNKPKCMAVLLPMCEHNHITANEIKRN